jgi:serine-type D-Ala-D-Ala endopeptidase (penicillin-binding protein 7)
MHWCRALGSTTLAFLLLVTHEPAAASDAPQRIALPQAQPEVRSHAFYVLDESDSSVLAARHERVAAPIASITKLMTALVVLEAGQPLDEVLTISAADVSGTAGNGSRLAPGYRLTRDDLLRLALMSSENRAAHALCRSYPDGLPA